MESQLVEIIVLLKTILVGMGILTGIAMFFVIKMLVDEYLR